MLLATKGEESTLTQSGSSVTDAVTEVTHLGSWLRLPHRNISTTGFSAKGADDAALSASTDYLIDATWLKSGLVWIPSTSSITVGEDCKWTYTYAAVSGATVKGDTQSSMTIKLLGLGRDLAAVSDGQAPDMELEVWQIDLDAEAELNFKSGQDIISFDYTGTLITPSDKTSPYEIRYLTFS
jgi:hypothetical protein